MAKVTMHKATDGSLHDTAAKCTQHDIGQRILKAVDAASFNMDAGYTPDDQDEPYKVISQDDLSKFIAQNADVLRKILNGALIVKRPRKSKVASPTVAAQFAAIFGAEAEVTA
jgi:hypothetical protein